MKVLITGGAGYIGTSLIHQLLLNQHINEIVVYDNLSRANYNLFIGSQNFPTNKVRFIHGDILDSRKLKQALINIDVVYHLAAMVTTPFSDSNSHLFEQVNHWGTAELTYAIEENISVKKLVYLSSCSVYGFGNEPQNTQGTANPATLYGISKLRGEEHINRLKNKVDVFVFRCGNVYGYNRAMRFDAVINRFMFEAQFFNKVTINGDGTQHRPFIHLNKCVNSITQTINNLNPGTYNLIDQNLSVLYVAEQLKVVYPTLETIFVNHHLKLRELFIDSSIELIPFYGPKKPLSEELAEFKTHFSF